MTPLLPRLLSLASALALGLGLTPAVAQAEYPERAIRMVVPFPPGGATDNVSRLIAKSLGDNLGQSIVVENRAGAGGVIGADAVANATPDGYTLLYSTAGIHIINPAIYEPLSYDPLKDWEPVGQIITAPLVLNVRADSPFNTVEELIAHAKANPGALSYGSAGNGSSLHQNGEMFKHAAGVDILHVPYRGAGPAMTDLRGGRVDMMFSYLDSVLPGVKDGDLRILAVGSPERLPLIPDVPTVGEVVGQPDYDATTWTGLVVPDGTPRPVVDRLNQAIAYALEDNRARLEGSGYLILGGSPDAMRERIDQELQTVTPLLRQLMLGLVNPTGLGSEPLQAVLARRVVRRVVNHTSAAQRGQACLQRLPEGLPYQAAGRVAPLALGSPRAARHALPAA